MRKKRFLAFVIGSFVLVLLLNGSASTHAQGGPPAPPIIEIAPCDTPGCDLIATFRARAPQDELPLSADLLGRIMDSFPLALAYSAQDSGAADRDAFFTDAALGLSGAADGQCDLALPHLENASRQAQTLDGVARASWLNFFRALCLRRQHDYPAALAALDDMQAGLIVEGDAPRLIFSVRDAYRADTLFLNFELETGLAVDDANLEVALQEHDPADPLSDRLLAELYLLRGSHRLYFYEWDAALDDYDAALGLEHVPARVFYFRGLLYYTRSEFDAARADLARYLDLEADPGSPLAAQAERYLEELEQALDGSRP